MSSRSGVVDPLSGQGLMPSYWTIPQGITHVYELPFEERIQRWSFESMQTLATKGDAFPGITLSQPTYIQTSAKVDTLRGSTLIIHDSHNIGDICASMVVMYNSTAKSITADEIVLLFSDVKDIEVRKKLHQVIRSKNGVDSSASFTTGVERASLSTVLNEEGYEDFVLHKGKISDPKLTAKGQPRLGMINQTTLPSGNGSLEEPVGPLE